MVALIQEVSSWALTFYYISGMVCHLYRVKGISLAGTAVNTVWKITKWPGLANVLLYPLNEILEHGRLGPLQTAITALHAFGWWLWRNGGDDDWTKKLKDKCADAVKSIGHRLVVVAAPT